IVSFFFIFATKTPRHKVILINLFSAAFCLSSLFYSIYKKKPLHNGSGFIYNLSLYNTIHAAYRQYPSRISRQVYKNM
ncbi:MAG: hypothetical protein ACK43K_14940, partial [Chitinophagales bacterium]